jgi:hypothetical protein
MLVMKIPKDLEFEPVHPEKVLLASVAHGISCLFEQILKISEGAIFVHPHLWLFFSQIKFLLQKLIKIYAVNLQYKLKE